MQELSIKAFHMPPALEAIWETAYADARKLRERMDFNGALARAKDAWDLLPEPKLQCSMSHITLVRLLQSYGNAGQFKEGALLADWILENTPFKEVGVPIFAVKKGILLFDSGDLVGARSAFDLAWNDSGDWAFQDEDEKYLKFYRPEV